MKNKLDDKAPVLDCKLTKRLEFDAQNRYLIVYGGMDLNVIAL